MSAFIFESSEKFLLGLDDEYEEEEEEEDFLTHQVPTDF